MAFTSAIHTAKRFKVLTRRRVDGKEFVYLGGLASTAIGSWVTYDELGVTILLDSDAAMIGPVAIAMAATVVSTFGWYQVYGSASGLALTAFADNGIVHQCANAGSVDDSEVTSAQNQVYGAWGRSAVNETTFLATFQLSYPFVSDATID